MVKKLGCCDGDPGDRSLNRIAAVKTLMLPFMYCTFELKYQNAIIAFL